MGLETKIAYPDTGNMTNSYNYVNNTKTVIDPNEPQDRVHI